jgi:alkyldihydroxyacetonephosphate synthase
VTERSWWGWGRVDRALPDDECVALAALLPGLPDRPRPVPELADVALPASRIDAPGSLPVSLDPGQRASHTYGKAYRDIVRALSGDLRGAPDAVACPRSEADVVDLLDWAAGAGSSGEGIAVVPYGGGSSVVGGVEYRGSGPWLSLDLTGMSRVLEIDPVSRAARIQAGTLGPALEEQLRPHRLTLRHFPQSFEFSTLGGWLATRAGGHYATLYTHIDDLVESMRVVTPVGVSESWRLPGSGAGPSPDRLFLGSEGTLGVITEAWMRLQDRPRFKASTSVTFADMTAAMAAVRAISQAGLHPANCRLLDPGEAALSGAASSGCVLVLGVESAVLPVEGRLAELVELARDHGGTPAAPAQGRDDAADVWRSAFLRMPYVRDGLARMSAIVETFETACTWDRAAELYDTVRAEVGAAVEEATGTPGLVNCRFTHVYPDGPAPYFSVIAAGRPGSEVAMWDDVKAAATETLGRLGATITHHHAVGRDHRRGYDRQRPEPFAVALRAAKAALDPAGILNPGVLFDAEPKEYR